jgi:predicted O-linked N-acetylglucosamine transferase (SPINDLY family)
MVIKIQPNYPEAHSNKGNALNALQLFEEALLSYDRAIELNSNYAEGWSNKGATLNELKRYHEALGHFDRAIKLNPNYAEAWNNKGTTLNELKRHEEALSYFDRAIELNPRYAEAWSNKGATLRALKRHHDAMSHFDQAIELNPNYAEAWSNRGGIFHEFFNYVSAIECFKKACLLKSDIEWALGDFLYSTLSICLWEDIATTKKDIAFLVNKNHNTISPFTLLALADDPPLHKKASEIFTHSKYPANLALGPITPYPPHEKIRIGYFSANFYNHAVGFLLAELFELHDKNQFELIGFSFGRMPKDDTQRRIAAQFNHFYEVENMSDTDIVQLSRSLNIDIAVDLMGFTQDARTGIFAHRAAPVQVNYLGYPGTMGTNYIDYIIADTTLIPPESQQHYSEKIVYLPNCYQANDRKRAIADKQFTRRELGIPDTGFVFACFNNNFKILPATFDAWVRILNAVEGSVLWLLADNPTAKQNLLQEAQARGLDPKRLVFADRIPLPEHLARHRQADLFLDTWPYNAHTTASDALWAGLPVLTMLGQSFASRVAASLLNAIRLPELITKTQEEYESLAIKLAHNPQQLRLIKEKLHANRLSAPLFDTPLFTKHLELAYTKMYEQHHAKLAPDNLWIQ